MLHVSNNNGSNNNGNNNVNKINSSKPNFLKVTATTSFGEAYQMSKCVLVSSVMTKRIMLGSFLTNVADKDLNVVS